MIIVTVRGRREGAHANKCRLENVMRKEGKRKRILASLLVFAMLVTMLPINLFSGSTTTVKAEGEGEQTTPETSNLVVNGDFEAETSTPSVTGLGKDNKNSKPFGNNGSC